MTETYLSNWITNYLYVQPGHPVSYDGRPWMPQIFDTDQRYRCLKTSRQVGKSTAGLSLGMGLMGIHDYFVVNYIAPEKKHCQTFSREKIDPMMDGSPIFEHHLEGDVDNVFEKRFSNKSSYKLNWAKRNPDRIRGGTSDMIHYDEVQDLDVFELAPVVEEQLTNSRYKYRLYTGTPKSFSNPLHHLWQDTDRREWLLKCEGCNKWNNLGISNIGKVGPVCESCGKALGIRNGKWVAHNPGAKIAGFHVNKLHLGVMQRSKEDWQEIIDAYESYELWRFKNEVLGLAAETAEVPVSEGALRACCDPSIQIEPKPLAKYMGAPLYAGIDWGHGSAATVLVIGQFYNSRFRYLFMKKYEGDATDKRYCIPDIVDILERWSVKRVHSDYGGGFGMNEEIRDRFGKDKVTTNYWPGSTVSSDKTWSTKHSPPRLMANKSKAFGTYIRLINKGSITFPCEEEMFSDTGKDQSFAQDFLNVRREPDANDRVRYIKAGPEQHDDTVHACIYAYMIARMDKGGQINT